MKLLLKFWVTGALSLESGGQSLVDSTFGIIIYKTYPILDFSVRLKYL